MSEQKKERVSIDLTVETKEKLRELGKGYGHSSLKRFIEWQLRNMAEQKQILV